MKRLLVKNLVNLGFYLALGLIMAMNGFELWNAVLSLSVEEEALLTYEIRTKLNNLLNVVSDAANSQRNYVTMGDEQFLTPYRDALGPISVATSQLQELAQTKPGLRPRLQKVQQRIDKELDFLKRGIELVKTGQTEAAKQLVDTGEGLAILDSIRRLVYQLDTEEEDFLLLKQRWEQSRASNQRVLFTSSIGTCVSLVILLLSFSRLKKEIAIRTEVEGALLQAKQNLESLVAERTGELRLANSSLRWELAERQRAEDALRESEARFRNLLEYIPGVSIVGYDNAGIVRYWNKASERIYGYTAQEAVQQNLAELIIPEELQAFLAQALQVGKYASISGEFLPAAEQMLRHKNGSLIPTYTINTVVCLAGRPPQLFCINVDLSERQKAEEERLKLVKLESLGILAGGIAHDFNNILTAILGNISLASWEAGDPEHYRERLHDAEKGCLQAQRLARQLLTFAKGGKPIRKTHQLKEVILEAVSLALCGSRSRCELLLPDDLWLVEVDAGQIHQVMGNLLLNADQAMPEGGIITLEAANLRVSNGSKLSLPPGHYVKVAIADNGVGISPEHQSKIFDPYFTTKKQGNGLGLATVFSIIKNHRGTIDVKSELGKGTVFHIYLPTTDNNRLDSIAVSSSPVKGSGRILLMDDDEMVRTVLGRILQHIGYEVSYAQDGSEAVAVYLQAREKGAPFTAVIFDLTIPGGMGGKEAMRHLQGIDPEVRAIVSSGYSEDPVMADFRTYGFSGVIAKPYTVSDLSRVLQESLSPPPPGPG